jgi:leucine dehydrogenase
MDIFQAMQAHDFEQLVFCQDRASGLKGLIAIHSTALGPALGGTRMWSYASEAEAVTDALRLARGMSYKAAVAGLPLGGGKGVIIGDPEKDKSEALFKAYGRRIQALGGSYITAEDVCTCPADMDTIKTCTPWVVGTTAGGGDPSPYTALGVVQGIRAALRHRFGQESLRGISVAVQGLGHVGSWLCHTLSREGVRLKVTDIDPRRTAEAASRYGAEEVQPEAIFRQECDVFSPCALGAVLNDRTIPELRCSIVAGAANNVLDEPRHGLMLHDRGILYVPDYVINAGGLICVADQLECFDPRRVRQRVDRVRETCLEIFALAEKRDIPPFEAADRVAEERMLAGRARKSEGTGNLQINGNWIEELSV